MKLDAFTVTLNIWGIPQKEIEEKLKEFFPKNISKKKIAKFHPSWKTSSGKKVLKEYLLERDGGLCHWCKDPFDFSLCPSHPKYCTIEHLKRRCEGGSVNDLDNLALACSVCNNTRHNKKPKKNIRS
jgi:hypothetical protein